MAASRLNDRQKEALLKSFLAGESTTSLAISYGCSVNTVSRTVKALLSSEEYAAAKLERIRRGASKVQSEKQKEIVTKRSIEEELSVNSKIDSHKNLTNNQIGLEIDFEEEEQPAYLPLDDADDFGNELAGDTSEEIHLKSLEVQETVGDSFYEIVPLADDVEFTNRPIVPCVPLSQGKFPETVYILVDKSVELDTRPLKEFPELGFIEEKELERKALCLFPNPRSARRQCGRTQRVIKIPDTTIFKISTPYLLQRGITRLILDGSLIALDQGD